MIFVDWFFSLSCANTDYQVAVVIGLVRLKSLFCSNFSRLVYFQYATTIRRQSVTQINPAKTLH